MLVQPSLQATTDSLKACLSAHLDPDIHLPSLVRLLDVLAHIALLADKLNSEIKRIGAIAQVSYIAKDKMTLRGVSQMAEEASRELWNGSIRLRELAIAKALLSTNPKLKIIDGMVQTYYGPETPRDADIHPGHSSRNGDGPLFLSATPDWLADTLTQSSKRVRHWHSRNEASKRDMEKVCAQAEDIRVSVLDAAGQVFECMDTASEIFDAYAPVEVKDEAGVKLETDARRKSTPRVQDLPRVAISHQKHVVEASSPPPPPARASTSRSAGPSRQVGDPDKQTAIARQATKGVPESSNKRERSVADTNPVDRVERKTSTKPVKKRGRPSFPPREGPDYTRPLPTASPDAKRQRLHAFQAKDLKR